MSSHDVVTLLSILTCSRAGILPQRPEYRATLG
jgi:hypothetical protein